MKGRWSCDVIRANLFETLEVKAVQVTEGVSREKTCALVSQVATHVSYFLAVLGM